MAAICGETDEDEVESGEERIFQERDTVEVVQTLKEAEMCDTTVKLSRGGKPPNEQLQQANGGVAMSTRSEGAGQRLTSSATAVHNGSTITEPPKRGRGRPRKQPQIPTGEPSKRPRGRPKGTKNKSPTNSAQKVPYSQRRSKQVSGWQGSKRGRKAVSGQVSWQPWRENGFTMSTRSEGASQLSTFCMAAAQDQPASTEPLKKGRGRPRKQPQDGGKISRFADDPHSSPDLPPFTVEAQVSSANSFIAAWELQEQMVAEMRDTTVKLSRGGKPPNEQLQQANGGVAVSTRSEGAGQRFTSSATAAHNVSTITEPPKRGRGRPRKQPQIPTGEPSKRPRGRPKGTKNKNTPNSAQKVLYSQRRSKPVSGWQGSKRGEKAVSGQVRWQPWRENGVTMSTRGEGTGQPSTFCMAVAQEQPASTEPLKKGRGRPRKQPQEPTGEPFPKRPRGRPKGRGNKSPSKAAQKVPYSKRWRERKQLWQGNGAPMSIEGEGASQPLTSSVAAAQDEPANIVPPKKGQGRPRKQPQVSNQKEENFDEPSMVSQEVTNIVGKDEFVNQGRLKTSLVSMYQGRVVVSVAQFLNFACTLIIKLKQIVASMVRLYGSCPPNLCPLSSRQQPHSTVQQSRVRSLGDHSNLETNRL
ncbi:hypothetical protein JD844_013930 [Phrynosoma platyrhinos]|uniref:Uncharacterized protein n=1 Tax=Phrynosoma platyrhinos TaxID=52577 RepID=A0ABQ7TLW3_PHRPL|nr:hypothetical protein JD844_013930 [Phrynosoma platyrhinos]